MCLDGCLQSGELRKFWSTVHELGSSQGCEHGRVHLFCRLSIDLGLELCSEHMQPDISHLSHPYCSSGLKQMMFSFQPKELSGLRHARIGCMCYRSGWDSRSTVQILPAYAILTSVQESLDRRTFARQDTGYISSTLYWLVLETCLWRSKAVYASSNFCRHCGPFVSTVRLRTRTSCRFRECG